MTKAVSRHQCDIRRTHLSRVRSAGCLSGQVAREYGSAKLPAVADWLSEHPAAFTKNPHAFLMISARHSAVRQKHLAM